MIINSQFDGGNIRCIDCCSAQHIQLAINPDAENTQTLQWFYFRLSGARGQTCRLTITNAGDASYLDGWKGYRAVASYNRRDWFRIDTRYEAGQLIMEVEPQQNCMYFAYFAPYSLERLADFVAGIKQSPVVDSSELGQTLDGRTIECLTIGDALTGKKNLWIIARQHAGETMASWWMEGFLLRLTDRDDAVARQLLEKAVFHVVPNMNPDGSFRGHLRTNAAGMDLNRQWRDATVEKSPEVYHVKKAMAQTGVDFCLDVHGDEALPHNFIATSQGIPGWNQRLEQLSDTYQTALKCANPDFQTEYGYPRSAPGQANLALCSNYIGETYSCLAMTLEMPFKDTSHTPDPVYGWSPQRCKKLGASNLNALYGVIDRL